VQLVHQYKHIVRDDTVNAIGGPGDGRGAGSAASSVGTPSKADKGHHEGEQEQGAPHSGRETNIEEASFVELKVLLL